MFEQEQPFLIVDLHFVSRITQVYYDDYPKSTDKVIWLQKGQYLGDVLLEKGFLERKNAKSSSLDKDSDEV